ncbi:MAG: phospholipid carrier-dependent glycosyltransferase [Defluviitaleaceae bacterium]|nr:phospholipid carrier-dependent glycosyltransferase [Defluviitaleaceae bacterium]
MPEKMTNRDWLGIIILTLVCGIISFARLGDFNAPQTSWMPEPGERAIIDFGVMTEITEIQFRMGARHDRGFTVSHSTDGERWEPLHTVDGANVFYWTHVPVGVTTRFISITATGWDLRLQEIAFRGTDGELLTGFSTSPNAYALTDEQHLTPERRSFMNSTYFDEIYHPRTGYEFAYGLAVYETTHPPLGKVFIAASVRVLGMTPFGWRFPGALFGVMMVPLLYAFARALFRSNRWALFAAFIFAFDFMRFTQTRLATIDTYVTFFVIAMYFFMYLYVREVNLFAGDRRGREAVFLKKSLFYLALCGAMMGLAVASKWQGVYGAIGLPILFFPALYKLYTTEPRHEQRKTKITFMSCFIIFVAVPLVIYTLSYIPFMLAHGGGLRTAWNNQMHMYSYHAELVAEHNFASDWWSWPILQRPIWLYVNRISSTVNAGMTSFGNPAVWWFGIAATVAAVFSLVRRKGKDGTNDRYIIVFLLVAFAAQYLPWAMVSRLTFIYHFFPSVPFVILFITWFFKRYVKKPAITYTYAGIVAALFVLFYPVLSGLPMNVEFVRKWLAWLPGWVFM